MSDCVQRRLRMPRPNDVTGPAVPRALLVVPCFNEARRLDTSRFLEYGLANDDVGFIFVDDGSTDATGDIARAIVAEMPAGSEVIRLERNQGKAEAVRRGICHALSRAPVYVGYWDADLATPLSEVDEFRAHLDERPELQIVMGARVRLLGRPINRNPARHYLGRVFATAVAGVLGFSVYDTQCGAKLLRASPMMRDMFLQPFLTRWLFDIEILARLKHECDRIGTWDPDGLIYEHPVSRWADVGGSKVAVWDYFRAAAQLLMIRRAYLKRGTAGAD